MKLVTKKKRETLLDPHIPRSTFLDMVAQDILWFWTIDFRLLSNHIKAEVKVFTQSHFEELFRFFGIGISIYAEILQTTEL